MPEYEREAWGPRTNVIFDYTSEQANEREEWEQQQRDAEHAREIESDRKTWWQVGLTLGCFALGGGPGCLAVGKIGGEVAGNIGTWKDKDIEDWKMDTSDVGKWNQSTDLANLSRLNEEFEDYDKAEFWTGVKDIGVSLLTSLKFGGGLDDYGLPTSESLADFSFTKWGGQEAGKTTKDLMSSFFSSDVSPVSTVATSSPSYEKSDLELQSLIKNW